MEHGQPDAPRGGQQVVTGEFIGTVVTTDTQECRQGHWILAEGGIFDGSVNTVTRTTTGTAADGTPSTSMRSSTTKFEF